MEKGLQTEEARNPERPRDFWEQLQQLAAVEPERNATEEAISEFGLGDPRWRPFGENLRELFKTLAADSTPGKGRAIKYFGGRYRALRSDSLAVVLLKALCAVYDPRLRGTPQRTALRQFLGKNLPNQLQGGPTVEVPDGHVSVSLWDQKRVRPACQELLKLYREKVVDGGAVAEVLARSFTLRRLSREHARRIIAVIRKNSSDYKKARETVASYLNVSPASVDKFYKGKFTGLNAKSPGKR